MKKLLFIFFAILLLLIISPQNAIAVECSEFDGVLACNGAPPELNCIFEGSSCIIDPDIGAEEDDLDQGICNNDGDCEDEEYCEDNECVDDLDVGELGCNHDNMCSSDSCNNIYNVCVCDSESDCSNNKTCNISPLGYKICVDKQQSGTCDVNQDCQNGFICEVYEGLKECRQACSEATDCKTDEICFKNNFCAPKPLEGQPCATDADCEDGFFCQTAGISKACVSNALDPDKSPLNLPPSPAVISEDIPNFLGTTEPTKVIGRVVNFIVGLVGTIALVIFIYGGVLWLISSGREAYVDKGKDAMIWSAIGLAVVFASNILVKFVLKVLSGNG